MSNLISNTKEILCAIQVHLYGPILRPLYQKIILILLFIGGSVFPTMANSAPELKTPEFLKTNELVLYRTASGFKKFQYIEGDKIEIRTRKDKFISVFGTLTAIHPNYIVIEQDTVAISEIKRISHPKRFDKKGFNNFMGFSLLTYLALGLGALLFAIVLIASGGADAAINFIGIPLLLGTSIGGATIAFRSSYHKRRYKIGKKFGLKVEQSQNEIVKDALVAEETGHIDVIPVSYETTPRVEKEKRISAEKSNTRKKAPWYVWPLGILLLLKLFL